MTEFVHANHLPGWAPLGAPADPEDGTLYDDPTTGWQYRYSEASQEWEIAVEATVTPVEDLVEADGGSPSDDDGDVLDGGRP